MRLRSSVTSTFGTSTDHARAGKPCPQRMRRLRRAISAYAAARAFRTALGARSETGREFRLAEAQLAADGGDVDRLRHVHPVGLRVGFALREGRGLLHR